jgi:hypothetical protein
MMGLTEEEIISVREGKHSDEKLNVLISTTIAMLENKGNIGEEKIRKFYGAGYSPKNLIDLIAVITEKTFTNYIGRLSHPNIEFPLAPRLANEVVV